MASAKDAADGAIDAARRLQADALEIETAARRRLADEVDAAQERGELATGRDGPGAGVLHGNAKATAADIGLSRKEIYGDRKLRDAEAKAPGLANSVLNALVDAGKEPTRAALGRAVEEVLGDDHREPAETIAAASHAALDGKGKKSPRTAHPENANKKGGTPRNSQRRPYPTDDRPAGFAWLVEDLASFGSHDFRDWPTRTDRGCQEAVAIARIYAPSAASMVKLFERAIPRQHGGSGPSEVPCLGRALLATSQAYVQLLQEECASPHDANVLGDLSDEELVELRTIRSRIKAFEQGMPSGL
jgi:hypothetical protein